MPPLVAFVALGIFCLAEAWSAAELDVLKRACSETLGTEYHWDVAAQYKDRPTALTEEQLQGGVYDKAIFADNKVHRTVSFYASSYPVWKQSSRQVAPVKADVINEIFVKNNKVVYVSKTVSDGKIQRVEVADDSSLQSTLPRGLPLLFAHHLLACLGEPSVKTNNSQALEFEWNIAKDRVVYSLLLTQQGGFKSLSMSVAGKLFEIWEANDEVTSWKRFSVNEPERLLQAQTWSLRSSGPLSKDADLFWSGRLPPRTPVFLHDDQGSFRQVSSDELLADPSFMP